MAKKTIPTRIKSQDTDRHRVALETLGESVEALRVAHQHGTSRLADLTVAIAKGEADLATAKDAAEKQIAKAKAEMQAKRLKTLTVATEQNRKAHGLLDELNHRLARVKDTL